MNKINTKNIVVALVASIFLIGCVPSHLAKYTRKSSSNLATSDQNSTKVQNRKSSVKKKATIFAIDKQTYRFSLKDEQVWNAALDVLMRNYNLTIVDHKSGVITTEWDSFYLNGDVYRNRVSIRLSRLSWNSVNLTVVNNVETLKNRSGDPAGNIWLPGEDKAGEVARIIQNMALVLRQPEPVFPTGMAIAKDVLNQPIPSNRR